MKMLRAKLYEREEQEKAAKMGDVHAQKKAIEWGSQIRSYVLAPYTMVNDHRTELKQGNVAKVLDGEIDDFIQAYLLQTQEGGIRHFIQGVKFLQWPVDNLPFSVEDGCG